MGLREDAEAARIAGIQRRAREKAATEAARNQREEERRSRVEEEAMTSADTLGIEFDEASLIWVTDPPAEGYSPPTYLHIRSVDGVWLRYSVHMRHPGGKPEHRWMVVQKCPYDDHWLGSNWSTTLEGIGEQLSRMEQTLENHIARYHS